jgi:hypothetical protein
MKFDYTDIVGIRFDRLLVVSINRIENTDYKYRKKKKTVYYNCECLCGRKKVLIRSSILRRFSHACGCIYKEKKVSLIKEQIKLGNHPLYAYLYNDNKNQAKYTNKEFTLTFEEHKSIVSQECHYCNEPWSNSVNKKGYEKYGGLQCNGIDRKDSSKGYTLENSLPCCKICNRAKNNMKYEDFLQYLKRFGCVG